MDINAVIAKELGVENWRVDAAVQLLDEGNTVPFIARYRKEKTGTLTDEQLRDLDERLKYLRNLEERKASVIASIEEQGKLTEDLKKRIEAAETLVAVEDLYAPYKQKKRTRAMIAKEKGLLPFAQEIMIAGNNFNLSKEAEKYISEEKEVLTAEDALQGASDIIAEDISDTAEYRAHIRKLTFEKGSLTAAAKDKDVQALKVSILKDVYRVLALCLGVPPTEFIWRKDGKTYTPQEFYRQYLGQDLENNYVMVMNNPTLEYGKVYEIDYDRHVYDGQNWVYVNLPMDRIKEMAIASIKDNTALYFSCDVAKFLDRGKGVADIGNFDYQSLLGVDYGMDKRDRILTHASGSTHAMTLIAVDIKDGKPVKWMVENSWGETSGYKGNIIMTDEWFDNYMFRLVVEKKYVPGDVLSMMNQKPVLLPAWDPMFAPEE